MQDCFFQYVQIQDLMINMAFCQDLIQTLKNPFEQTRWRFIRYMMICTVVPFLIVVIVEIFFPDKGNHNLAYDIVLGLMLSLLIFIGMESIILAYKRLARPGVSREMRQLFLKKHAIYVIVLICLWILCLMYNYNHLFNPFVNLDMLNTD